LRFSARGVKKLVGLFLRSFIAFLAVSPKTTKKQPGGYWVSAHRIRRTTSLSPLPTFVICFPAPWCSSAPRPYNTCATTGASASFLSSLLDLSTHGPCHMWECMCVPTARHFYFICVFMCTHGSALQRVGAFEPNPMPVLCRCRCIYSAPRAYISYVICPCYVFM
jgi:hypothetical protein